MDEYRLYQNNELFSKAAVPLCIITKYSNKLFINKSFEKNFGYSSEEIPTLKEWLELSITDNNYREQIRKLSTIAFNKAKSENRDLEPIEYKLTCKSGQIKNVIVYISFVGDDYLITYLDITDRINYIEENELLSTAINNSSDSVFINLEVTGNFVYVNNAACNSLGYTRENLLNMNIFDIDPELNFERLNKIKEDLKYHNKSLFEANHKTKEGKIFPVEVIISFYLKDNKKYSIAFARDITERKKHELDLIKSEQKYRSLAETIPDSIIRYDKNGKAIYMNSKIQNILNLNFDNLKSLSLEECKNNCLQPELYYEYINNLFEVLILSKEIEFEFIVPELLPQKVIHLIKMIPERNDKNEIIGVLTIGRDITERKLIERKLYESERQLSILFKKNPLPTMLIGIKDHIIIDVNDEFIIKTGYKYEEVIGRTTVELNLYDDLNERENMIKILNEKGFLSNYEFKSRAKNGQIRVQLNTTTIININDEMYYLSVFQDITELKNIEQVLVKSEYKKSIQNQIANIFLTIPDNEIYNQVLDIILNITKCQYGFFGYLDENDILEVPSYTKNIWNIYSEEKNSIVFPFIKNSDHICSKAINECKTIYSKGTFNTPFGHADINNFIAIPIIYQKKSIGLFGLANKENDFTEEEIEILESISSYISPILNARLERDSQEKVRYKAEKELIKAKEKAEESDKLKSAFLHNMSHEIRTPLNGIIGFANLIKEDGLSFEDKNDFVIMINKSMNRLIDIIDNVIEISRITTGQIEIFNSIFSINELIICLYSIFEDNVKNKNLKFIHHLLDNQDIIYIKSDESKLQLIFSYLIQNSIKFTVSGVIEYGCIFKENEHLFFVKDTGIGIDEMFLDKVFDIFYQVDSSITRRYEGAGLGLSICKGLIELLNGKIWVESELGVGSTFWFSLPQIE